MYYIIESRWPEWSWWKNIGERFDSKSDAKERIETLRKWNSGEFRVSPVVDDVQLADIPADRLDLTNECPECGTQNNVHLTRCPNYGFIAPYWNKSYWGM